MELLLICPHCKSNLTLASRKCQYCGGQLEDLPAPDRRYVIVAQTNAQDERGLSEVLVPETEPVLPPSPFLYDKTLDIPPIENKNVSLCEALDRILNKGAVLFGEVLISVADVDLIYLGLQVVLASMETARGYRPVFESGQL
jgi:hypothetical protein